MPDIPTKERLQEIRERAAGPHERDHIYTASKYDDDVPWLLAEYDEALAQAAALEAGCTRFDELLNCNICCLCGMPPEDGHGVIADSDSRKDIPCPRRNPSAAAEEIVEKARQWDELRARARVLVDLHKPLTGGVLPRS